MTSLRRVRRMTNLRRVRRRTGNRKSEMQVLRLRWAPLRMTSLRRVRNRDNKQAGGPRLASETWVYERARFLPVAVSPHLWWFVRCGPHTLPLNSPLQQKQFAAEGWAHGAHHAVAAGTSGALEEEVLTSGEHEAGGEVQATKRPEARRFGMEWSFSCEVREQSSRESRIAYCLGKART